MPYVYRCGVCKTSSRPGDGYDAQRARDEHRRRVHHGLVPDGETIESWRGDEQPGGLRGCLVAVAGIVGLAAYGWIRRHV